MCTDLINFACLTAIKKVKEKHIYGGKLLEAFMKHPYIEVVPFDDGEHDEEMKEKARCKREGSKNKINIFRQKNYLIRNTFVSNYMLH